MDRELLQDSDGVNESFWDGLGVEFEAKYIFDFRGAPRGGSARDGGTRGGAGRGSTGVPGTVGHGGPGTGGHGGALCFIFRWRNSARPPAPPDSGGRTK